MELPRTIQRLNRRHAYRLRAMVCLVAASVAIPALFVKTPADAQDRATTEHSGAVVKQPTNQRSTTTIAAKKATTTAPATTAPPTTVAPTAPPTTEPAPQPVQWTPPPTTAPAPPPTAAPTTVGAPANSESGIASYYDDPGGGCAHKTLPFGTVVHITASNGRSATCVVDDRGPFSSGRILDLDTSIFAQLAPLGAGLINVTATW